MSALRTPNDLGEAMYGGYLRRMPDPQAEEMRATGAQQDRNDHEQREEPLPLPKWLVGLYFLFPIVLYIPDAIFNLFVYSDGVTAPTTDNTLLAISQWALWGFLSIGVVGMAYLLSVLAPWHWMHRHRLQAVFCGLGVIVATAITTWNSLAYRSQSFHPFATDQWVYGIWPQLQAQHISLTMIFVAVAPPFWGLFWAVVQPVQTRRNLAHLQESHAERLLRLRQEAEMKTLRAEANVKIRAAQLKGMAQTAAAAREQAGVVAAGWRAGGKKRDGDDEQTGGTPAAHTAAVSPAHPESPAAPTQAPRTSDDVNAGRPAHLHASMSATVVQPMKLTAPKGRRQAKEPASTLTAPHATSGDTRSDSTSSGRGTLDHVIAPGSDLPISAVARG